MNSAMEQTRYWMWARRKFGGTRPLPLFNPPISNIAPSSSYHESLEEQVFAEDSAGLLGGCIWPPRSYTCSFCRREFRSAQALGGHMNVHRRDRARLKQSTSPTDEGSEQYPADKVTPLEYYSPSPNPNPNPNSVVIGSFTNPIPVRVPNALELRLELGNWKVREVGGKGKRDWEEDVEIVCSTNKRIRTDEVLPSIVKPSFGDRLQIIGRSEVLKLSPSPVEELDLELRLGDPPKVK